MSQQLIKELDKVYLKKDVPKLKSGLTIRVHQKIIEGNKERIQVFEGLIIAKNSDYGLRSTITVRKVLNGYGVEKIFLVHSPNIEKIEIVKEAKIRRAKLYFMRKRSGKSARLNEKHITKKDQARFKAGTEVLSDIKEQVKVTEEPNNS